MEQKSVDEQLKQVLKNEKLSWQKYSDITGESNRSNFRKKLLGWLQNADEDLKKIGYRIEITPIREATNNQD